MAATKYDKLEQAYDYDHDAVKQLVEAMKELQDIRSREAYLSQIIKENEKLHPFVWYTAEGEILAHDDIEDDHLKNIMQHLLDTGRPISRELRAEAHKRSIPVPQKGINHLYRTKAITQRAIDDYNNEDLSY